MPIGSPTACWPCRVETRRNRTAAVVCVPGDIHALGAELFSRYLECRGWTTLFLGASMPQRDLLEMLAANRPHAVVVSIRMTAFLPAFKELATAIRAAMPEALLLAVGTARITPVLLPLCNGVASTFAETQALLEKGLPHA